jgi:spore coat protein CotH
MPKILILIFACLVSFSLAAQTDLYNPEKIQEIRISFDDPNWFQTLHEYKEEGNEKRLEATLVLNGTSYEGVGVRFKGNSSYYNVRKTGATKLPFNIKANFTEKGQRFPDDIKTLKLSNVFRDPSFLREVLSYEIAAKYMPSPRAGFSRVYVNDEYLGLYNLTESVDENFLEDHFGENQGTFVKCDPAWGAKEKDYCPEGDKASLMYQGDNPNCYFTYYEMKSDSGWTELIDLTKVLTNEPERIEEILDVDMALWMLAFNNVLVNLDSYTGRPLP